MSQVASELTTQATSIIEAFNSEDWDGMRSLIGDATYNEVATQRSLTGDEVIEAMQGWKAAFPDATGTVTNAVEGGRQVALEVTWRGTQTGDMVTQQGTIPASGKEQTTPAAFIYEYDESGNLKETRHYFDMLALLKQIGAA